MRRELSKPSMYSKSGKGLQLLTAFFRRWREHGLIAEFHDRLRGKVREREGRETEPTAGITDALSEYGVFSPARYTRTWPTAWSPQGRGRPIASQPRDRAVCPGWGDAPSRSDARRAPLTGRPVTHPQRSGGPGSPART